MARQELELDTDPATVRKLVIGGIACVACICVAIGGAIYALAPRSADVEAAQFIERSMVPTRFSGRQLSALTGGKINGEEFDELRRRACEAIESMNASMPSNRRQPTCEQMHDILSDPQAMRVARERMERMARSIRQ